MFEHVPSLDPLTPQSDASRLGILLFTLLISSVSNVASLNLRQSNTRLNVALLNFLDLGASAHLSCQSTDVPLSCMDLEVITFKFTGNMKLLAFELCTLHLFSKSQQSYTTDIFKTQVIFDLEDFKNSVIALHGSYTGSKTWSITYSENLGGTITQKELVIDGISESGRDASTTNQGCCGMEFFSNGKKIQDLKNKVAFNH
ncbi:unnamed protein product [Albugo candida]|uniref:Uncharacterized protein n=1 Tax=Albugo candida TaxID=65357 RepID=A0A024GTK9_9STRA|nr:unnamed protein product [Albugo candida]|eukprot:CCI50134.1 unnamed protein product [Albugo candida]